MLPASAGGLSSTSKGATMAVLETMKVKFKNGGEGIINKRDFDPEVYVDPDAKPKLEPAPEPEPAPKKRGRPRKEND